MDFIGLDCPVCGKAFTESDDIVVCPQCGAPYHRACYQQTGHCVFEEKHGTPDAWKRPQQNNPQSGITCSHCGRQNEPSALFCSQCGHPLADDASIPPNAGYTTAPPEYRPAPPQQQQPYQQQPAPVFPFDPMGGVQKEETIEGIRADEMARFVQSNTQYYLPVFHAFANFRKIRFNFGAFLFSGGWLLYRKQYRLGTIFTALIVALNALSFYILNEISTPLMLKLAKQVGVDLSQQLPNAEQYAVMAKILMEQNPMQILMLYLPFIVGIITLGIMIYLGFNANRLYLKYCVEKIHQIHESTQDPSDRALQFQMQGGINAGLCIVLLILYAVALFLPNVLTF